MATSGKLRLHIIEAKLNRDTETFGKMDPYATFVYRDQTFKTKVKDNAGKLPKWNEIWDIDVKYIGDDMTIQVLDKDLTSSDLVGETTIKLSGLCANGGMNEWYDIQFKGKKAGSIHLKGEFVAAGGQQQPKEQQKQAAPQVIYV